MTRLLVHVEGPTEEVFVNEVLAPHLYAAGWQAVSARILGSARSRGRRGGIRPWEGARRDIQRHLREDPACHVTTLVDYYALPEDWPGRAESPRFHSALEKVGHVEAQVGADLSRAMGDGFRADRFLPFIAMHEFEAWLFSDCTAFSRGVGLPGLASALQAVRDGFATPEDINDSPETAPSKRILALFPRYNKPLYGNTAALEIGLAKIRTQCPHFAAWLGRLEQEAAVGGVAA